MTRWEYRIVDAPARPPVGDNRAIDHLNKVGGEGWEAVGVVPLQVKGENTDGMFQRMSILLKREILAH